MRVLAGCEKSGIVRDAFLAMGHDAWSCDILSSESRTTRHLKCNVLTAIANRRWDLVIFFPPCTHLAVSGARWFKDKQEEQAEALEFVRTLLNYDCERIALENPVSVISTRIRKPTQIIQPWQFWDGKPGQGEVKTTCLWLKGLPKLVATTPNETGRIQRVWRMAPGPNRAVDRGRTYTGIASAMANQWGGL